MKTCEMCQTPTPTPRIIPDYIGTAPAMAVCMKCYLASEDFRCDGCGALTKEGDRCAACASDAAEARAS